MVHVTPQAPILTTFWLQKRLLEGRWVLVAWSLTRPLQGHGMIADTTALFWTRYARSESLPVTNGRIRATPSCCAHLAQSRIAGAAVNSDEHAAA